MEGKKDDEVGNSPFVHLDKGVLLQETRIFHDPNIVPSKCIDLIAKIMFLLNSGDKFSTKEATDLFFALTKLFQSKDANLRRVIYLVLKELTSTAEDVIIMVASLTKDMTGTNESFRANSIRVLIKITDAPMLAQLERHFKQAIVDKQPYVSSIALVSAAHLMNGPTGDVVKRWTNEVNEACSSKTNMGQYHAIGLLSQIKHNDRLAISKLVVSTTKAGPRSPHAHCLLVRLAARVIDEDPNADRVYFEYLDSCLRNKNEMVTYEAARAICNLKNATSRELTPAITVLQMFLNSPRPTMRFAALRTLNQVAVNHPLSVATCNMDMEGLVTDANRNIATLAITTLLKTGNEGNIDRLVRQISSFMSEIADEFKIVVVDAICSLCLKFPHKQRSFMNFLSTILREEGGFDYKKAIVDTILTIMRDIPDSKEAGLLHLSEFIEDCEFTQILTKILHLIGEEGPTTSNPSKFIRYIYNRVLLENATVRASAVAALAKFGIIDVSLRPQILILLRRCLFDSDDEVRDRAAFYLHVIQNDVSEAMDISVTKPAYNFHAMEAKLVEYLKKPTQAPFHMASAIGADIHVPVSEKKAATGFAPAAVVAQEKRTESATDSYGAQLRAIPQFAALGKLCHSTRPVELTESETEYVVNCVKHFFTNHIVFQFNVTNTLNSVVLENVLVKLEVPEDFAVEHSVPIPSLPYSTPGVTYVCVRRESRFALGSFSTVMSFRQKEVDPDTQMALDEGYDDDYQMEDFEVSVADYINKTPVREFSTIWDKMANCHQYVDSFSLSSIRSIPAAVTAIIENLGMCPCEKSEEVSSASLCFPSFAYLSFSSILFCKPSTTFSFLSLTTRRG
eukprot:TRINITY_DN6672_c0_g2_i1.p1 TRINITY_DN6672_c0_g2~~TRINITY_DN6672_c0_g2_i1.p1  ORF type:complete len:850 (+),score=187.47 TRINITY_DN6672_c0_g2_i1:58-2607(+)